MPPASRLTDNCIHPNLVASGSPDTIIGGLKAARLGDRVTPCPVEPTPPGMIVKGSGTVFINSMPAARIGDAVGCGVPTVPPPGGTHDPVEIYEVKDEDNYVAQVFKDDGFLIREEPESGQAPPPPDEQPERKPATFLDDLHMKLDVGSATAIKAGGGGPNMLARGMFTVIVGG